MIRHPLKHLEVICTILLLQSQELICMVLDLLQSLGLICTILYLQQSPELICMLPHPLKHLEVIYTILLLLQGGACGVKGGACGVMVIVVGNGHDDTSSNPRRD